MRRFSLYIIYIVVATILFTTLFSACGKRAHNPLLLQAESMVIDHPDSALALLEKVRPQMEGEDKLLCNLVWAEAYYMQTKAMEDSVLRTIYRVDENMGEEWFLMKNLLYAVYLYRHDSIEAAHSRFLACNSAMGEDFHPYWKCMVNDYLAFIYLNNEDYEQAKTHFYDVVKYAKATGNERNVANAYSRISSYYYNVDKHDSALHYAKLLLSNKSILSPAMQACAYHNLSLILMASERNRDTQQQSDIDILASLQSSLQYKMGSKDSLITYALIAQVYYNRDSADLAMYYQQLVESGDENIAKMILYKYLRGYYDASETTDSAYKYMKLYDVMDSICRCSQFVVKVQTNVRKQAMADAKELSDKRTSEVISGALLVICIMVGAFLYYSHCKKQKNSEQIAQMTSQIDSQESTINQQTSQIVTLSDENQQLKDDLKISQEESQHLKGELAKKDHIVEKATLAMKEAEDARGKFQELAFVFKDEVQDLHKKVGNMNVKLLRAREKTLTIIQQHGQIIFKNFRDGDIAFQQSLDKAFLQTIIDAYSFCGKEEAMFMHQLKECVGKLSPTQTIICILYREGFTDKAIIAKLQCTSGSFRKSKSNAYTALKNADVDDRKPIKDLLQRFASDSKK